DSCATGSELLRHGRVERLVDFCEASRSSRRSARPSKAFKRPRGSADGKPCGTVSSFVPRPPRSGCGSLAERRRCTGDSTGPRSFRSNRSPSLWRATSLLLDVLLQPRQHLVPVLLRVLARLVGAVVVLGQRHARLVAFGGELDGDVVVVLGRVRSTGQRA